MAGEDPVETLGAATVVTACRDISPTGPATLGGFSSRRPGDLARDHETPLEANGLLLRHDGKSIALITLDTLYAADLRDRVLAAARQYDPRFDSRLDELIIAASHTHFAPMIDGGKPGLGAVDMTYRDALVDHLAAMIAEMLDRPGRPACLRSAHVDVDHAINRRRMTITANGGTAVMRGPNPSGAVDRTMMVGVIEDADGEELAVLWSWACHPVCSPCINRISADFPGHVRRALRRDGPDRLPVLYLQGFSGDARPRPPTSGATARPSRNARASAEAFPKFTASTWETWTGQVCASVLEGRSRARAATRLPLDPAFVSLSEPLEAFVTQTQGRTFTVAGLKLTQADLVVFASAEISGRYGLDLRAATPDLRLFPASCAGDAFGYLATAEQMAEGGYEAGGFLSAFGLSGRMRPDGTSRFRAMADHTIRVLTDPDGAAVSKERLVRDIRRLGLKAGDTVLARASMRTVNTDSDTLIDALLDVLGPDGTLAILAFTPIHPLKSLQPDQVFTAETPPTTGGFALRLMQRPEAMRSRHPTNSWVALGPKAEFLLASHGPDEPAFEPIRRLMEVDGKFAVFGCVDTCPGFSTIHYIENLQGQSTASPHAGRRGVHYLEAGRLKTFARKDVPGCSRGYWHFYKDYFEAGVLTDDFVGLGYSYLMSAIDAYAVEVGILNQDPGYAICETCTCPKAEVVRTAPLSPAPDFIPAILRAPDLDYESMTFADALAHLGPTFDSLTARPGPALPSLQPPESLRDCIEAALHFVAGGCENLDIILDARIALSEYGRPHHVELLIWMLNAAQGALPANRLSQIASGMPLAALSKLDRRSEIDWLVAYNRLRKPAGLDRGRTRDAYKTFIKANLAELHDSAHWLGALSAFSARTRTGTSR
jgi:aminoglycoside N3'-acetyltransferase